jgi:hypothetical protein
VAVKHKQFFANHIDYIRETVRGTMDQVDPAIGKMEASPVSVLIAPMRAGRDCSSRGQTPEMSGGDQKVISENISETHP